MLADILFYTGVTEFDRLIQLWTNSPINHVAIDIGDGTKIEALSNGIARTPTNQTRPVKIWSYYEHVTDQDAADMDTAKKWLLSMVGKKYGWSDIASAADIFSKFVYAVRPGYYDCSALACEFLIQAGGVNLGELALDPHLATPASLAKQLGVT